MEKTPADLSNHITAVQETLQQLQINFQNSITSSNENLINLESTKIAKPLDEIPKLTNLISAHATKLGLVFKPPIENSTLKACWTEIDNIVRYSLLLISLLTQLNSSVEIYSKVFINELSSDSLNVLDTVIILIQELNKLLPNEEENEESNEGNNEGNKKSDPRLIGVGMVWESCEKLLKTSKSGSSGVLRNKLKSTNKIIIDALDELNEWLENPIVGGGFDYDDDDIFGLNDDGDDNDSGNEDNDDGDDIAGDEIISAGKEYSKKIQLVKLLISLLDKSIPSSEYTVKFSKSLDILHEKILKLNEYVDDIIACIIYDSDLNGVEKAAKLLTKEINQIVELVRKINNNNEKRVQWLNSWKIKYEESK